MTNHNNGLEITANQAYENYGLPQKQFAPQSLSDLLDDASTNNPDEVYPLIFGAK